MRPDDKERVLLAMKNNKRITLMCGDGANDVGALKQAHVGIALLSGFGDLNVSRDKKKTEPPQPDTVATSVPMTAIMTKESESELLKLKASEIKRRLRKLGVEPDDFPNVVEKADLVQLYRAKWAKKETDKTDLQRHKELMALPIEVWWQGHRTWVWVRECGCHCQAGTSKCSQQ
jgi:manganese-transporting P-type ATPase